MLSLGSFQYTPESVLYIRVRNLTGKAIENFWMRAGEKSRYSAAQGAIEENAVIDYGSYAIATAGYNKFNFVTADGQPYLGLNKPDIYLGKPALEAGHWYTFEVRLVDNEPVSCRLVRSLPTSKQTYRRNTKLC